MTCESSAPSRATFVPPCATRSYRIAYNNIRHIQNDENSQLDCGHHARVYVLCAIVVIVRYANATLISKAQI